MIHAISHPMPSGRAARAIRIGVVVAPFVAILIVLAPYLWPLDHAPTSDFSDIQFQYAPNLFLLEAGLADDGELPRWNRQDFSGTPTLGDPQAGIYNPIYWLLLLRPTLHSFGLMIVAHALAGAFGFVLYARTLGLSLPAAALGAVAFTLGGKILLQLVLPGHSIMAAFFLVPFALWGIERTARRPTAARIAATAAFGALVIVGLHPQVLFYAAVLVVVAALAAVRHAPHPGRACAALAAAAGLTGLLTAVHVLPFLELAGEFSRAHPALYDVARWDAEFPAVRAHWSELMSGAAGRWEAHYFVGGVTLALVLLGVGAWPSGDPQRRLVWLHGGLGLFLLLYGLGPEGGIHALLAGVPGFAQFRIPARALIVLGLPTAVLAALGGEALLRAAVRARVVGLLAAAATLAVLLATQAPARHYGTLALAVAGALLALGADRGHRGAVSSARRLGARRGWHSFSERSVGPAADAIPGDEVKQELQTTREGEPGSPPCEPQDQPDHEPNGEHDADRIDGVPSPLAWSGYALVIIALAIDTAAVVAPSVKTKPETEIGRLPAGLTLPEDRADVLRIAEPRRHVAHLGIPELEKRRRRLETLAGYNSLVPWRFILFATYASGYDPIAHNVGDLVPIIRSRPRLFDILGVTDFLYAPPDGSTRWWWERSQSALPRVYLVPGPVVVPESAGDDRYAKEFAALARLDVIDPRAAVLLHGAEATAALTAIGGDTEATFEPFRGVDPVERTSNGIRVDVETTRPAILVLNEPFFRGWRARDGDQAVPVLRANVMFRAVALSAGRHRLTFEFAPTSWRIGRVASAAGVVIAAALLVAGGVQEIRRRRLRAAR